MKDHWWYPALWPIAVLVGACLYVLIMVVMNSVAWVESRKGRR